MEREFRNTCKVHVGNANGLFSVGTNKDFCIRGIGFEGSGNFIAPSGSNVLTDCNILYCGFQGFNCVYNGKILRCNFSNWYVNGGTGTQLSLGGSDSVLFEGMNFMGGTIDAGLPFVQINTLAQTKLGKLYITPQGGYGLQVNGSSDCEGLVFYDFMMTCWGRTGSTATQQAGIQITGGEALTFYGSQIFNVNAADTSPGDITVTGGQDHIFDGVQFIGTHAGFTSVNLTKPAIYTEVPIVVRSPRAVGGRPKTLQQSTAGLIQCDDPTWTITTAPA